MIIVYQIELLNGKKKLKGFYYSLKKKVLRWNLDKWFSTQNNWIETLIC